MKKLFVCIIALLGLVACTIDDVPSISFNQELYVVSHDGGELIIPVSSTGIDKVTILYDNGDSWEIDAETGDMTPKEGWIKLVKVINNYETRALAQWTSGIRLEIAPNDTNHERTATITARSFSKEASVSIRQGF